jgi:hypothetical protein
MARIALIVVMATVISGCGLGVLQTARPVARGVIEATGGTGMMANDVVKAKTDSSISWSFAELGTRLGLTDHLDVGGRIQFFPGGLLDFRYNFLAPNDPLALSISGGIGGSVGTSGAALHVPLSVGVSYDWPNVSPYAHLGWSHFWFFKGEPDDFETVDYVDKKGHGDGILRSTAGVRFKVGDMVLLYLEYNYWLPLLNDEGDFYKFDDTHVALIGLGFLSGSPIF